MIAPPRDQNLTDLFASATSVVDPDSGVQDLIGALLAARPSWHADSLCQEHPEVNFFPRQGDDIRPAKRICSRCLVFDECRSWTLDQGAELDGIWAGTSNKQRTLSRRQDPELRSRTRRPRVRGATPRQQRLKMRPTAAMERVSAFLAAHPDDEHSTMAIDQSVVGGATIGRALTALLDEGYLTVTLGGAGANGRTSPRRRAYRHVRPYLEAADPEAIIVAGGRSRPAPDPELDTAKVHLEAFLAECCTVSDGHTTAGVDLHAAYSTWAEASGQPAVSRRRLEESLTDEGWGRYRGNKGTRWRGVALGDPAQRAEERRGRQAAESRRRIMHRVSTFLADHPDDPHTAAAVLRSVKGVETPVRQALVALADEGYACVTTMGARRLYRHVRPYAVAGGSVTVGHRPAQDGLLPRDDQLVLAREFAHASGGS